MPADNSSQWMLGLPVSSVANDSNPQPSPAPPPSNTAQLNITLSQLRKGLASWYELGVEPKSRRAILRHTNVAVIEKPYVKPVSAVSVAIMADFETVLKAKQKQRAFTEAESSQDSGDET